MVAKRSCIAMVGAGGHASVVSEILSQQGRVICSVFEVFGQDMNPTSTANAREEDHLTAWHDWVIALGDCKARAAVAKTVLEHFAKAEFPPVISNSAVVSPSAKIGHGAVIMPLAHVGTGASVGEFAIVNSLSNLEHHSELGNFAHLAPGATILGGGRVGQVSLIGGGAVVDRNAVFPSNSTLGANGFFRRGEHEGLYVGSPADIKP